MDIKIIPSELTPKVIEDIDVKLYVEHNAEFIQGLIDFAKTKDRAAGIAANQMSWCDVRIMKRFFLKRDFSQKNDFDIIFNPKITKTFGTKVLLKEGCLTWENSSIIAERYLKIEVSYQDYNGTECEKTVEGFEAQLWQHEIDHLNGVIERLEDKGFILTNIIGRNEPCPCGSGKKFKNCHYFRNE